MSLNYITALMHLIYEDEDAFITELFNSKENFFEMRKWLYDHDIYFKWLKHIDDHMLNRLIKRTDVNQVEALTQLDLRLELDYFKAKQQKYTNYILLPGFDESNIINKAFISHIDVTNETAKIYQLKHIFQCKQALFTNPTKSINFALFYADKWPGIIRISKDGYTFIPITNINQIHDTINNNNYEQMQCDDTFFIHLSDLHLGTKKNNNGKVALIRSLDNLTTLLKTNNQTQTLITGDIMNSPNKKNMYHAAQFVSTIKKRYKSNVTFILGNHDVIVNGLNLLRFQKSKVIAFLLTQNVVVLEKEKLVIIKVNSAFDGNFARGKVGHMQLQEIDEELNSIDNLHRYKLLVMLHHHVIPTTKADFIKKKWNEGNLFGKVLDSTKALVDSKEFLNWLSERKINYVCHGHKHIPFFTKYDNFYICSAGSSCGVMKEASKQQYLSYNLLKYSNDSKEMKVCLTYYDNTKDYLGKRIVVDLFE